MASPRETMSSAMLMMTDTEPELRNLEMFLRGMRETKNGLVQVGKPLLNNDGVTRVVGMAQALANKNIEFGHHDSFMVRNIMKFANYTIVKELMLNRGNFSMGGYGARDAIHYHFLSTVYSCVNRGEGGGERSFWGRVIMEFRQMVSGPKPESQNAIQKLFNR